MKKWRLNRVDLRKLSAEQRKNFAAFKRQLLRHHRAEAASVHLSQHGLRAFSVQAFSESGRLVSDWNL